MRFTTQEIEAAVDVLTDDDGVPVAIGGDPPAGIGHDTTLLARSPVLRLRTARGAGIGRQDASGIPVAVQHEDAAVCFGLWCAA